MIIIKHILVPTDFSEASEVALRYGRELARSNGATLHVLHVVQDVAAGMTDVLVYPDLRPFQVALEESASRELDALVSREDCRLLNARPVVLSDTSSAVAIVEYAREIRADLVVMGTHGRSGAMRLVMGSVAERVVRTAPCPVLTVRHPEHEFLRADALQVVARA